MLALTTGVVWFAGRALSPRAGLIAGCVHATTFWPLAYGTSALVDGTLAALVAWCVFLGARDHVGDRSPTSWAQALAFWVLLALAALAKGPIGLCLALPPVMAFRWMHRGAGMRFFWRPATLVGLPLALGLSLAWPLAILQAHPEAMEIWTAQSVGRFAERFGEQTRPWYYYGYAIFGLALPWLPLALASTFRSPADETSKGTRQVLWLWFGWAFLFCSLSAGKRAHYLLPGLAPLSVLAAIGILEWSRRKPGRERRIAPGFALAATALVGFMVGVRAPLQTRSAERAMIERHGGPLAQFGSGDHWAAFTAAGKIEYVRTEEELRRRLEAGPATALVPAKSAPGLAGRFDVEEIDRPDPGRRPFGCATDPDRFLLLRLSLSAATAGREPDCGRVR